MHGKALLYTINIVQGAFVERVHKMETGIKSRIRIMFVEPGTWPFYQTDLIFEHNPKSTQTMV